MTRPQNSDRCTYHVFSGVRHDFAGHQCTRRAVKDGLCTTHQPDVMEARRQTTLARQTAKWERDLNRQALLGVDRLRALGYKVFTPEAWRDHERQTYDCGGTRCGTTCCCTTDAEGHPL